MMVDISVLIPAYNEEKYLSRCIRSLTNQHNPQLSFEILVQDDCSTDSTSEVCKSFDTIINYEKNSQNLGLPATLNRALSRSKGNFITRVDADDYVNCNYLNFLKIAAETNPNYDAVACDYQTVDDEENILCRKEFNSSPIGCATLFKKSVFQNIGNYDEFFRANEDKEFLARFNRAGLKMLYLPIPLYRYRRHSNNMTNDFNQMAFYDQFL